MKLFSKELHLLSLTWKQTMTDVGIYSPTVANCHRDRRLLTYNSHTVAIVCYCEHIAIVYEWRHCIWLKWVTPNHKITGIIESLF